MSDSLISIIVPVYNSENTLHRCINSIIGQTYENFELLLINDGSNDRSKEICEEYAKKDSRIRVFHKKNGGVSSARNIGLINANGDRVTFVDSDDLLLPDALVMMCSVESDLVIMNSLCVPAQDIIQIKWTDRHVSGGELGDFIVQNIQSPLLNAPWSKMFNRRIIMEHHLSFDEKLHLGEDSIFVKQYLMNVNSIDLIDYVGYEYNYDGLMYQKYSKRYEPFYAYYLKTIKVNKELSFKILREISSDKTIHLVYDITIEYLKTCSFTDSSLSLIKCFLSDEPVYLYLNKCKAIGMHFLAFAGRYLPKLTLPLYGRLLLIFSSAQK